MTRVLPDSLETQRLLLREPCEADARGIFESYAQDAQVCRYMTWRPHSAVSETEEFIARCRADWSIGHRLPYVLAFRAEPQQPIGMLDAIVRSHTIEIGYVLARRHWGLGLMPEAVRALTEIALALPRVFRVQATCDVENRPSARVLEKSGFLREGRLERYIIHPTISADPRACYLYARCR